MPWDTTAANFAKMLLPLRRFGNLPRLILCRAPIPTYLPYLVLANDYSDQRGHYETCAFTSRSQVDE